MKFRESKLAHQYLDGLKGLEIGASAHNPFGLNTTNVDFTDEMTVFKRAEVELCGEYSKVDIVAPGDKIPVKAGSYDFVLSSHVVEHMFNPIAALKEWRRVIKQGGYIFTIAPIKELTPGEHRPITKFSELLDRHNNKTLAPLEQYAKDRNITDIGGLSKDIIVDILNTHHTVFDINLFVEVANYVGGLEVILTLDNDDKVGNGFCVILKKK